MNWARAIELNQAALMRVLTVLMAWVGLVENGTVARLPRHVYRRVLSVLGPAESALRRLIVIAARDVVVTERARREMPEGLVLGGSSARVPAFALYDPRRVLIPARGRAAVSPRLIVVGEPFPVEDLRVPQSDEVDGRSICRRLISMQRALGDLRYQARRLARCVARASLKRPMRAGRPPGFRQKPAHAVDTILRDLHELALWAQAPPDTAMVRR